MRRLALAALVVVGAAFVAVVILEIRTPPGPTNPSLDSPNVVMVPDVVGTTEAQAAGELIDEGFDVALRQEPSENVAEGLVIRTDPAAGSVVAQGSQINVFVSSGE